MKACFLLCLSIAGLLSRANAAPPPGIVISHSPASSGYYIGSPSICALPDGSYLASHDLFGPSSKEHSQGRGRLFRSTDKGASWRLIHEFEGFFWTGLFTHRGAAWLLGADRHHGRVVIRRSEDSGKTWTGPVVLAEGQWHTAPMPVIEHGGRLWRAIEDAENGNKWGERYRARMMSAPADADLLDPENWTFSNPLARDPAWLGGDFAAWLEGNAVAGPAGDIVNILRVDQSKVPEKAAIVRISRDGSTATFDAEKDFVDFPGGAKKFTIRKDPRGGGYWALANIIPESHAGAGRPASIRNTLALVHSPDLRAWETRCVLLHHPDTAKHGFQYVDWQFDGSDLVAACRTAWDDAGGGARNHHDANFLTFHRWNDFRTLTRSDDVPMPDCVPVIHETSDMVIKGGDFEMAVLDNGVTAFSNRNYQWQDVPPSLAGCRITRLAGGGKPVITVTAKSDLTLRVATADGQPGIDLTGWKLEEGGFAYNDRDKTRLRMYSRALAKGGSQQLPRGNWTGGILVLTE